MHIENVTLDGHKVTLTVGVEGTAAPCPLCQCASTRVHSRYRRTVTDPTDSGRPPADEVYRGKRRTPQPRLWEQRAEEESERRLALRRARCEAVIDLRALLLGYMGGQRESRHGVHIPVISMERGALSCGKS